MCLRPCFANGLTAWDSTLAEAHPFVLHAGPFARLAERMALPQTACLALSGPLAVPFAGRAWFPAFDCDGDLIEVLGATRHTDSDSCYHLLISLELRACILPDIMWELANIFAKASRSERASRATLKLGCGEFNESMVVQKQKPKLPYGQAS